MPRLFRFMSLFPRAECLSLPACGSFAVPSLRHSLDPFSPLPMEVQAGFSFALRARFLPPQSEQARLVLLPRLYTSFPHPAIYIPVRLFLFPLCTLAEQRFSLIFLPSLSPSSLLFCTLEVSMFFCWRPPLPDP